MYGSKFKYVLALLITHCCLTQISAQNPSSTIKDNDNEALNWLKNSLGNSITMDYIKTDNYLQRWLKANKFDQNEALKALKITLQWRENNRIDNLPTLSFRHLRKQYPIDFDSIRDKSGKLIILVPFGAWDIRTKAVEGKLDELKYYLTAQEEKAAQLSYNLTGDPTATIIVNFRGFDLLKHACFKCLQMYFDWIHQHRTHYPYNFDRIVIVNLPEILLSALNQLIPLTGGLTSDSVHAFGLNENEWTNFLLQTISEENIPFRDATRFGAPKCLEA